jgi:hypothetical protein
MRFPLEVVGIGKKNITRRSHIKYAEKDENDGQDGRISKK